MFNKSRGVIVGAVLVAVVGGMAADQAAAEGDPRPPISEIVTFRAFNEFVARVSLMFVRSAVDFTYQDVVNDPYANTTSVTGLTIRPELRWDRRRNCVIEAERLKLASAELQQWDRITSRIELSGVTAPLACLPPEAAISAGMAELEELRLSRMQVMLDYRLNTSSLRVDIHATLPGVAAVAADLQFAYVSIRDRGNEPIKADLAHAAVTVDNLGIWEKVKPMMPPAMAEPDSLAQMVEGGLTQMFADMGRSGQPGAPTAPPSLTPAQTAFVQSAAEQARAFAAKPGMIVVETDIEKPLRLTERMMDDPNALFEALKPAVNARPMSRQEILPAVLLNAALTDPSSLSEADRLRAGRALVSGENAPRSPEDGLALLRPLAEAGNGTALVALAGALAESDPVTAYGYALRAGATGADGAQSVLDRLEVAIATPEVLTMQASALSAASALPSPHDFVPLAEARAKAMAHLRGSNTVRSYARAYYWSLLGKAANDAAAASLADEIEARMRYRGDAAAEAWKSVADQARADALAHWLTADYPARLNGQ